MTGRLSNRELFCAVLMEMCEDQSLDGISVSGLCKRAGVSRQTFYTYFSDINDLVCYAGSRPLLENDLPICDIRNTRLAYEYALRHRGFFSQLPGHSGQNSFRSTFVSWTYDKYCLYFIDAGMSPQEQAYRRACLTVFCEGSTALLLRWFATGMETPVDTLMRAVLSSAPDFMVEGMHSTPRRHTDYPK